MGFFKKIFKPIRKVLDKVVPNEIKPFLPYAAAAVPFLAPASLGGPGLAGLLKRGLITGVMPNIAAQLAQEGADDDINWLSAALAGTTGALTGADAANTLRSGILSNTTLPGQEGTLSFLDKSRNFGLRSLAKGAEFLGGAAETLQNPGMNMETLKAASIPFIQGTGDAMGFEADAAMREYEKALAAYNAEQGALGTDEGRREAILAAMRAYNHPEELIESTLEELGLRDGGRVGLAFGGIPEAVQNIKDETYKEDMALLEMDIDWVSLAQEFEETFNRPHQNDKELFDFYRDKYGADGIAKRTEIEESFTETAANGGIMSQRKPFVSGGIGKGLMKLLGKGDDAVDVVKQEEIFREGPITANFLENVDDKMIKKFIRTRDTGGVGGYGMYNNFAEMPAGLQAAELISRIKKADGTIDYETAEIFIGKKLKGNETIDELIAMVVRPQMIEAADGGIMAGRKPFVSGGLGKAMLKATNIVDETPSGLVDEFGAKLEYAPGSTSRSAAEGIEAVVDTTKSTDNVTMRPDMLDYNVGKNPQGIAAREFIESIRRPDGTIDYAVAEAQIGRGIKLRGNESLEELIELFLYNTRKDKLGVAAIGTGYGTLGGMAAAEAKDGGMMNYNMGGSVLPNGIEVDYRGGGFIPMGSKERADDVPARVSKNEFVMTADAVRAAGGGNVQEGAKRMYNLMNNLEARA